MLEQKIILIGKEIVECNSKCEGIKSEVSEGVLPRGLIFESGCEYQRGCMVVGRNPGLSKVKERSFYKTAVAENFDRYSSEICYWNSTIKDVAYYEKLRAFVRGAGIFGPIVWTDLAKCEDENSDTRAPIQTLRKCAGKYLVRELQVLPCNWPIFAAGAEAFKAIAYLQLNKNIIGIPHPTGAWGQFSKLIKEDKVADIVKTAISGTECLAIWMPDEVGKNV
jgi:hypothetical protein